MSEKKLDKKKTFKVKVNDKEIEIAVKRPDNKARQAGQQVYNRSFRQAIESGAIVRARIDAVMRDQNLWDDTKQKRYEELNKQLLGHELRIKKGGLRLKDARELAIQMRRDRWELRNLNFDRNQLDLHTAEAQAENERFNFLVSSCTVFADTGKGYFKDVEDYLTREDDEVAPKAATTLGKMMYGLEDDFEHRLPENAFLSKYKFVDETLHLIDNKGRLIDVEGHFVNKDGRLINEKGELIDNEGNLLTEDGEYLVDFAPFLDDDGDPIPDPDAKIEAEDEVEAEEVEDEAEIAASV